MKRWDGIPDAGSCRSGLFARRAHHAPRLQKDGPRVLVCTAAGREGINLQFARILFNFELKRTQVELEAALSNSREARQVVFDLFQDLEGFSLDDYKPFCDVSSSLERLVRFLSAAVADHGQRLVKVDDETYDLVKAGGTYRVRFTLNRDLATERDDLELMRSLAARPLRSRAGSASSPPGAGPRGCGTRRVCPAAARPPRR